MDNFLTKFNRHKRLVISKKRTIDSRENIKKKNLA